MDLLCDLKKFDCVETQFDDILENDILATSQSVRTYVDGTTVQLMCFLLILYAISTHILLWYALRFQQACSFDWDMECDRSYDMDQDWFNTFFDYPVLNDRMISDASNAQPQVQSEHSYSMATSDHAPDMTVYGKSGLYS